MGTGKSRTRRIEDIGSDSPSDSTTNNNNNNNNMISIKSCMKHKSGYPSYPEFTPSSSGLCCVQCPYCCQFYSSCCDACPCCGLARVKPGINEEVPPNMFCPCCGQQPPKANGLQNLCKPCTVSSCGECAVICCSCPGPSTTSGGGCQHSGLPRPSPQQPATNGCQKSRKFQCSKQTNRPCCSNRSSSRRAAALGSCDHDIKITNIKIFSPICSDDESDDE